MTKAENDALYDAYKEAEARQEAAECIQRRLRQNYGGEPKSALRELEKNPFDWGLTGAEDFSVEGALELADALNQEVSDRKAEADEAFDAYDDSVIKLCAQAEQR